MTNVRYRGNQGTNDVNDSNLLYTPYIWSDCPIEGIKDGTVDGYLQEFTPEAFKTSANVNAAIAYWADGFNLFGSDGAAVAVKDAIGGGFTFSSDGDNEGVNFQKINTPFQISRTHGKLWFEAVLATSTIADTKHGFLTGLAETMTLSATVPIAAAGTLADQNFVGWHRLEGDGDYADAVYKANGVTQVTVEGDAQVLVADTKVRLGMIWNPSTYKMEYYGNGIKIDEVSVISTAGTDFPNDVRMSIFFALLNATGSTPGNTTVYGIRAAQLHQSQ